MDFLNLPDHPDLLNMIRKSLGSDIAPGFSEPPEPSSKSSGLSGSPKPAGPPGVSVAYF